MKKSELRSLLKEVVEECFVELLPEMLELVAESKSNMGKTLVETHEKPTFGSHKSFGGGSYGNVGKRKKSNVERPSNDRGTFEGKPFASGVGILEWAAKSRKKPLAREFRHSDDQMVNYIKKLSGKK